jgi:hypothetical protein
MQNQANPPDPSSQPSGATIHADLAVHVHVVSTPSGDRMTIYTGPDAAHLQLSGILWTGRTASARIAHLLDPDSNTFERSATVSPLTTGADDIGEPS